MKTLIPIFFILLSGCSTAPRAPEKVVEIREPAQADELINQQTYAALFKTLDHEITENDTFSFDQFRSLENRSLVCLDVDGYGRVFSGGEVLQRRKRSFKIPSWVRCKVIPNHRPVEEIVEEVKARELLRNGL